ncbi:MAG: hypothetical protein HQL38_00085 [Alphaproteobacteria bacterium]|nr:hypothetical protein [Alphaproteobacteria bacterium]
MKQIFLLLIACLAAAPQTAWAKCASDSIMTEVEAAVFTGMSLPEVAEKAASGDFVGRVVDGRLLLLFCSVYNFRENLLTASKVVASDPPVGDVHVASRVGMAGKGAIFITPTVSLISHERNNEYDQRSLAASVDLMYGVSDSVSISGGFGIEQQDEVVRFETIYSSIAYKLMDQRVLFPAVIGNVYAGWSVDGGELIASPGLVFLWKHDPLLIHFGAGYSAILQDYAQIGGSAYATAGVAVAANEKFFIGTQLGWNREIAAGGFEGVPSLLEESYNLKVYFTADATKRVSLEPFFDIGIGREDNTVLIGFSAPFHL